ncbi:hypothetical protein NJB95_02185 [Brucella intermedia]|uniref:hypothetical protein n=1 Tax=Brucella intermedia TaxID=94625 RepID=UPI000DD69589|nr:hypothetical protein [Brucella intermedia]MCO7735406.1 hypothetical protein [Brucella intermedia]WLF96643.1 hypothetical protein Q5698_00555 [Brucella intermedia]
MDLMLIRIFQRQIELQMKYVLYSAQQINHGLNTQDVHFTFYAIQNLLNASANISKALWGSKKSNKSEQRKPLRDSFGVSDTSPLREVSMRNNFEHLDERLDRWWENSQNKNYCDLNLAPKDSIVGLDKSDEFRNFDPQTTNLTFWGEDFNLQAIVREVEQLLPKLQSETAKTHWE